MWNKIKPVYDAVSRELSKSKALRIFLLAMLIAACLWILLRPQPKPAVVVTPHVTAPTSQTVGVDSVTQAAIDNVKRAKP